MAGLPLRRRSLSKMPTTPTNWELWGQISTTLTAIIATFAILAKWGSVFKKWTILLFKIPFVIEQLRDDVEAIYRQTLVNHFIGEMMTEQTGVLLWEADAYGLNTDVSDFFVSRTGYSKEKLEGDGWYAFVHPSDRERVSKAWDDSVKKGFDFDETYTLVTTFNEELAIRSRAKKLVDEKGSTRGWAGFLITIQASDSELKLREIRQDIEGMKKVIRDLTGAKKQEDSNEQYME